MSFDNLLAGPPPTLLPEDTGPGSPRAALEGGAPPAEVAAAHPESSLAWAELADDAFGRGAVIESYAYARTGYHRGLDQLRRAGWKGHGPVPWEHEANRGFLRSMTRLGAHHVKLPDERSGTFMVFKTFDRLSYGLIMEATDIIRVADRVENP